MAKLIGNNPSQIPTNGDLGSMAFEDKVSVANINATGTKDATTFLRGDNTFAEAGGTNTPAFSAYGTTAQSVSSGTFTKVVFDAEDYDTDNAFDTSTYRFTVPSGGAGKYLVKARLNLRSTSDNITYGLVSIYKNGVKFHQAFSNSNGTSNAAFRDFTVSTEHGMILEVSDYIEIFGYAVGTSPIISNDLSGNNLRYSLFSMQKIIE